MSNNNDISSSISTSTHTSTSTSTTLDERINGRVKWFNKKAGYGFITVTDGSHSGSDIFIHHTSINVSDRQYKYLVQGEYVSFKLNPTSSGQHAYQATCVSGINNGKLMCETINEYRSAKLHYNTENVKMPVENSTLRRTESRGTSTNTQKSDRTRGEGSRESTSNEWRLAGKTYGRTKISSQESYSENK